ncbi:MAG: 16S rRNA (cytosine(1402)-N(4))-methyltransferase RsmH [Verrucomicrobiae bacterium]|nr:16S rRNA (cytosine(1402)-N(4))-methyltransferase RsmH [Verrucomicrobiae bacterium]MCX7722737.1 16S rRNA (cytosine(1402)-N(4))-methyltransferase RsmH [Verrucomicrobiae bacterium]MDW7981138.1 16S rRNA (cytosine(1402)-N(4))-methyltransferase RsmH [Verrucomicrobiales bacterium]
MAEYFHKPVLLAEVLAALRPKPGGCYLDATVGGGGHAAAILEAIAPDGRLFGCDRDAAALEAAQARLSGFTGRFELRRANFATIADWLPPESCDGVLFDLGPSSAQFDQAERGFSFLRDGPLDMRFDKNQTLTAADFVNCATEEELEILFRELGGERAARKYARAIVRERALSPAGFQTTRQLASLIERIAPRTCARLHPATKVFLALRVAVNDEVGSLRRGLEAALKVLKPGGRLAVITFHSLEDRVVKEFGRAWTHARAGSAEAEAAGFCIPATPRLRLVVRKPIVPSSAEVRANPRCRSAKLRVFEKV